ncbi:hypothetical protein GCM10009111_33700 [Colwellia asteriadis]|uniref:DUF5610 domain-containing protein n=1 Tax=Colwellia asteriadis TaxID=517723 RepID=A0ABN1LB52_9GAMM
MTKLNDLLHSINQRTIPNRADSLKSKNQTSIAEQGNEPIRHTGKGRPIFDLQAIKSLGKSGFAAKVMYQSIFSHFSSSTNDTAITRNQNLADIDLAKAEQESAGSLFDFEEVAKNVMAFIGSTILSAKSRDVGDEKLTELFDQARSGVEQGIGDALEVLKDSESLTEDIETGIEKSRDLINTKIDELHQQVFAPEEAIENILSTNESSISKSQTSSVSIVTAEGDRINIDFSASQGKNINEQSSSNSYQVEQTFYSERNFSYSVEGDLNDDEKAALGQLIEEVREVQHQFFTGDIEKAFEKATELNVESSQIASFSMNLTQQTSVSQKYSEVANNQSEASADNTDKRKGLAQQLKPAIDFMKQFQQLQQQAEQLLSPAESNINKFYDAIIKADFIAQPSHTLEGQLTRWHNILEQL